MCTGLSILINVAATYAMVIGSELHERAVLPRDHYIINSLVTAAVSCSLVGVV